MNENVEKIRHFNRYYANLLGEIDQKIYGLCREHSRL